MKKFLLRLTLRVKMTLEKWNSVGEFRGQFPEQGSVCSSIANYISKAGENDAETFSMLCLTWSLSRPQNLKDSRRLLFSRSRRQRGENMRLQV